jgi:hypothetical protein
MLSTLISTLETNWETSEHERTTKRPELAKLTTYSETEVDYLPCNKESEELSSQTYIISLYTPSVTIIDDFTF